MSENILQGNPTKTFFIGMITRDISIKDAILDLLDNSIDGANNINSKDYSGLRVELTINKDEFIIRDNCGGFSLETAQKYAFRFGRPDDAPKTSASIGRFGVGMKRALFKMGKVFEIESKTNEDHFHVEVDVEKWKAKKKSILDEEKEDVFEIDDWNFNYETIDTDSSNLSSSGTFIKVPSLNEEVSAIFEDSTFLVELEDDIEQLLNFSLEKGLKIILNNKELKKKGITLFSDSSDPYFHEFQHNDVKVRVIAGLSFVGEPHTSGWYIYCNDRLVLVADRSEVTGWGTSSIPKWHVDYVMFKGVIFMDSEETINLPLTTTKKGIDATSIIYKKTLSFMREAMTSVLGFLKEVRKLDDANEYRKLLGEQSDKLSVQALKSQKIETIRSFSPPELDTEQIATKKDTVRISYSVQKKVAEVAKNHSGSKSYKELGECTFEYYMKMEELQDE